MPGLLRGMARTAVIAGTATAVSNNVSRRQAQRWSNQAAEQQVEQEQYAQPQQEPATNDIDNQVAQLQQLAQLKEQGILTQAEFDAKKQQILGL